MSKYTTEVRFICEIESGLDESKGFNDIEDIISISAPKIFSFDYPIFDDAYKPILERKILRHYYTREICEETVGLWKLRLSAKMNEIMPYYNKLYKSELLEFNPLYDVDLYRKNDGTTTGTNNSNTKTTNNNSNEGWVMFSDTPQGDLDGVKSNNYLTSATKTTNEAEERSEAENNSDNQTVENYLEHTYGKSGGKDYSELLSKYRDTFLNIDMQIIDELKPLFFNLW